VLIKFLGTMTSNNYWIKKYGNKIIDKAYECPSMGWIWLVNSEKSEGLVKMYEEEWGYVDVDELEDAITRSYLNGTYKIFIEELPCSLKHLFETTTIWTYFKNK